ncbi:MAG TPA: hypothetical protein PKA64_04925 [Myxococcota bacterium]|nr:hypothetical protein [Myxococcota bacterium]
MTPTSSLTLLAPAARAAPPSDPATMTGPARRIPMRHLPLLCLLPLAACGAADEPGCLHRLDLDADGRCDADGVDWSPDAEIPAGTDRANLYGYDEDALERVRREGITLAHVWPNPDTGLILPWRPVASFLDDEANADFSALAERVLGFGDLEAFYDWFGLARFPPDGAETGRYDLPRPDGTPPGAPLGVGVVETDLGPGLTFSCAACHASTLFGRAVMGASNRRVRVHATFHLAQMLVDTFDPERFGEIFGATPQEQELYARNVQSLRYVDTKLPAVLGLDTAVAQVGLALAMPSPDPDASRPDLPHLDPALASLETTVADVKPAVWWNLRYKTRWSSDGIHASGNPVIYSLVANELGRGTDLVSLRRWIADNQEKIEAFTAAMFAVEAPRWVDFFGADSLDEPLAREGQAIYDRRCAECHGTYTKGWQRPDADALSADDRLANVSLDYHPHTPVIDVGTDPARNEAARPLIERLNRLAILVDSGTTFQQTQGYTPPPLDGLFARYPYLHNNSVPSLCALLSPPEERPASFWQGPAGDPATDFDAACVGYPTGDAVPEAWKDDEAFYDTTIPGLSNQGHDAMLRQDDGTWALSADDRDALLMFLKTL